MEPSVKGSISHGLHVSSGSDSAAEHKRRRLGHNQTAIAPFDNERSPWTAGEVSVKVLHCNNSSQAWLFCIHQGLKDITWTNNEFYAAVRSICTFFPFAAHALLVSPDKNKKVKDRLCCRISNVRSQSANKPRSQYFRENVNPL
jgi:hypothetical protein